VFAISSVLPFSFFSFWKKIRYCNINNKESSAILGGKIKLKL
jgi:hypothetical protein